MKLTEMLGQYEELLDKKDQLAKDTKDNNAAIDKLKAEIAEMMIDEDIPSQGYGDYIYSLQDKVKYSKRGEAYLQQPAWYSRRLSSQRRQTESCTTYTKKSAATPHRWKIIWRDSSRTQKRIRKLKQRKNRRTLSNE